MWYNLDLVKKQHSFMHSAKESYIPYVDIEHESGDVVIKLYGHKSGIEYGTCESRTPLIQRQQASHLTMRVYFKNMRNAMPNMKCGRDAFGIHGTMFLIFDKRYANDVLTQLFKEYDASTEMKQLILDMFDDWENLSYSKPTVSPAYPIFENIIVGNAVKQGKKRSFLALLRRMFACGWM